MDPDRAPLIIPSDHCRFTTSNRAVPLASETSVANSPVKLEPHVIFRQQQLPDRAELLWFVVAHPKQFRQSETRSEQDSQ